EYLIRVEFAHSQFGDFCSYRNFFRVPVCFQKNFNKLVFCKESLKLPTKQRDQYLFGYVQENLSFMQKRWKIVDCHFQNGTIHEQIVQNAQLSEYNAEAIAQKMNMSLRSLQRLARGEGYTVGQILENTREKKARRLLINSTLSIEAISNLLGYSDSRSFRRAFKRWTGYSPAEFRRG
ncbi:MAG: helix-turn-helix domain-containing protein, partial [Cyanobacteria bacterium P01_D01_bin.123]